MPSAIDLTGPQRAALRAVFAPYAAKLDCVGVYGSRAQGRARPGSDVDLVVYGPVSANDVARLRIDLEDSDLSIFADVTAYEAIVHPALKQEIDDWMQPLFSREDLNAFASALNELPN